MRLITQLGILVTAAGAVVGAATGEAAGWYVAVIAAVFTVIEYLASPRQVVEATPPLVQLGSEKAPAPPVPMFVPPPEAVAAPVQAEVPAKPKRTRKPAVAKPAVKPVAKPVAKPAAKPAAITAAKKPAAPRSTRTTKK